MNHTNSCPPEIWMYIFSFAFIDDGYTGRSASLVSRTFYKMSEPLRMQSLCITRSQNVIRLASTISRAPHHLYQIRYFFIGLGPAICDAHPSDAGDLDYEYLSPSPSSFSSSHTSDTTEDEDDICSDLYGEVEEKGKEDHSPFGTPVVTSLAQLVIGESSLDDQSSDEYEANEDQDILRDVTFLAMQDGDAKDGMPIELWPVPIEMSVDEEIAAFEGQVYEAIHIILRAAAPFLRLVQIRTDYRRASPFLFMPTGVNYTSLSELTVEAISFDDPELEANDSDAVSFPVLTSLRVLDGSQKMAQYFKHLARTAPSLVNLRFPLDPSLMESDTMHLIPPSPHLHGNDALKPLPTSVKSVEMAYDAPLDDQDAAALPLPKPIFDNKTTMVLHEWEDICEQTWNWFQYVHTVVWSTSS